MSRIGLEPHMTSSMTHLRKQFQTLLLNNLCSLVLRLDYSCATFSWRDTEPARSASPLSAMFLSPNRPSRVTHKRLWRQTPFTFF